MRQRVMSSLEAHCNRTYIDTFPNGFPHNNHVREVSDSMMKSAKSKCRALMRRDSGFCSLHCGFKRF